jgi:tol-pal system protein YbgF
MFPRAAVVFSCAFVVAAQAPFAFAGKDTERLQIQVATLQSQMGELQRQIEDNQREMKRLADVLGEQSAAIKKVVQEQKLESEATQIALKEMSERLTSLSERLSAAGAGSLSASPSPAGTPVATTAGGPIAQATLPPVPGGAPLPGELFSQAYADYTRGQYDLALSEFREYVKRFPDTERSDDAQYWIGVCLAGKQQFAEAIEAWEQLLQAFPSSDKLPDAYVKKGGALERLGKKREALAQYRYVVEHYPNAPAAKIARDKIAPQ